jgi:hypothetical protein
VSKGKKQSKTEYAEKEYLFTAGAPVELANGLHMPPDNDEAQRARHHDNETTWTIESYDPKVSTALAAFGAVEKKALSDGRIFQVDAKGLITFIAESSGLIVEFRTRRRQQLTPEKQEARRLRMAAMNAAQRVKV